MTPGRELDALVAEKVMGWTWGERIDLPRRVRVLYPPNCVPEWSKPTKEKLPEDVASENYPHYSTDIAAAWEVVAKLAEDGWDVRIGTGKKGWYCELSLGDLFIEVDTAPHAICLAALKAVGWEGT